MRDRRKKDARELRIEAVKREWASDRNGVSFHEVRRGSKKRYWWRCETCGWEWQASPDNRIRGGTGCPKCSGKVLTPETSFAGVRPDLVSWWDDERNGGVSAEDVFANTHKKYYFVCPHGHSYPRAVYQMTMSNAGGCKYCSGQVATAQNNLKVTHPDLAAQWHPTKNGNNKPEDYLSGSNKVVWWKCSRGHSWKASIAKRALRGDRCSKCHTTVSLIQARVYAELSSVFETVHLGIDIDGYEVDIYLPEERIAIEVDGYPWHYRRVAADKRKSEALSAGGIRLIRIRDTRLPDLKDEHIPFLSAIEKRHIEKLLLAIDADSKQIKEYTRSDGFQNERLFFEVAARRVLINKKNSLAYKYPTISREWDYEKNHPGLPSNFEAKSNLDAWWKCPDCGRSYHARISHRTAMGSGCPYCAGKLVTRDTSFGGLHPEALKEWDWERNTVDPYMLAPNSNVVCHWRCDRGHRYEKSPNKKLEGMRQWGKYAGCGTCYRNRGKKTAS